jgi:hypothetical protein
MAKRKVFYSFHFDNDVFRVQQIRNMGILEGVVNGELRTGLTRT